MAKTGPATSAGATLSMLPTTPPNLTAQGTILGTFQYMAPEQLEGGDADARTDIFAFGAVVYEMLTGRKAFEGKSQASLISSIMTATPPPIASLQPLAPTALDRVIRTCLAKNPDERWQSVTDLARELKWIAERGPATDDGVMATKRAPARAGRWIPWGLVALTTTAAVLLGLRSYRAAIPQPAAARFGVLPPKDAAFFPAVAFHAISPDGRRLVFVGSSTSGGVQL